MFNVGNVDETLIILSMMDQIIVDDLVQEAELEIFEKKKKWHDHGEVGLPQYTALKRNCPAGAG